MCVWLKLFGSVSVIDKMVKEDRKDPTGSVVREDAVTIGPSQRKHDDNLTAELWPM